MNSLWLEILAIHDFPNIPEDSLQYIKFKMIICSFSVEYIFSEK